MSVRGFVLDSSYRRPRRGRVVIGGSPLRVFTVTEAGASVLDAIEQGRPPPPGHERLSARLLGAGALHPIVQPWKGSAAEAATIVTVVIPARGELPAFRSSACRTIVVDDASDPPLQLEPRSGGGPVELVRLASNRGPGGARNAGLELVATPFVAFVDSDVEVDEGALFELLGHFDDPLVALVAPRVKAADGPGALAAFERRHSPLDQGAEPGRIAPTTRVSFVPAAAVVCRTEQIRALGGFDPALRFGEDVDLVWRLVAAGHRCRYEPAVTASHRVRPTLGRWLRQRVSYGSSAAALAERHPGALAPLRMSGWSAAAWAAVVAGSPLVGVAIGAGTAVALTGKLRSIPAIESLRLAGMGNLYAGRLIAATITRTWFPVAVVAAVVSRRARWVVAASVAVPAALDWRRDRPALDPARYLALRILDDAAYGCGVWKGALRHRSAAALMPSFEPWPPRSVRRTSRRRAGSLLRR